MKKSILLLLILLSSSCAIGNKPQPLIQVVSIEEIQEAATKSVVSLGLVLASANKIISEARNNGMITKEQYNSLVDLYNASEVTYSVLNEALQKAIAANKDPNQVTPYLVALSSYLTQINKLKEYSASLGVKL